jgi:hypothetical protein
MRICSALAAIFLFLSGASAENYGRPTAIVVSPIHEAQVIRGDDGMDHVEYDLLVVNVFSEPVTLASVSVLDGGGKELMQIEGETLAAATQTLFSKTPSPTIPASAAVSVDVDLILPAGAAPARVTHRIGYTIAPDSKDKAMIDRPEIEGPEVAVNLAPAIIIRPPVSGDGWLITSACCKPNGHRDERIAIDGARIETAETFAVDWGKVKGDRLFDGDGKTVEQFYGFGEDVSAVADGTVVSVHDGVSDPAPFVVTTPESTSGYGGNNVMLEIAPHVFAWYAHLRRDSIKVEVGEAVKAGARIAKLGNTGPSMGPHLHFGLLAKPDPIAGRSLPFVLDDFTIAGAVDFDKSEGDRLVIAPQSRRVRFAYPLYGGIVDFSEMRP